MDYKFRFSSFETVVCLLTGAFLTTREVPDFVNYIKTFLDETLMQTGEIVQLKIMVKFTMSSSEEIMTIFKENNILISHVAIMSDNI